MLQEQQLKLKTQKHKIFNNFLVTHILASLSKEYDNLVDNAKIKRKKEGLDIKELMKCLKQKYQCLKKTNSWCNEEMALTSGMTTTMKKTVHLRNNSKEDATCVERLDTSPLN